MSSDFRVLAALLFAGLTLTPLQAAPPLRICSDPNNMPFSNAKGQGF
jgi:hypothetical protein